jgi:hypothetical protein
MVAVATAAVGMSAAPPAAADLSNCQQVGATKVCGQGGVRVSPVIPIAGHNGVMAPFGGGCFSPYLTYQNCAVQLGIRMPAASRSVGADALRVRPPI